MNAARLTIVPAAPVATPAPARARRSAAPLRQIRNAKVKADELFEAVTFLAEALQLPALRTASTTNEAITPRIAMVMPVLRRWR
jgi:hypothetical protein